MGRKLAKVCRTLTSRLLQLMAAQRQAGKKVYILADMRRISKAYSSARLEAKWFLEEADYDALAVLGNRYLQPFIFFVLRDFKSRKSVEYFTKEHTAINWLLHSSHQTHVNRLKPRNTLRWTIIPLIALTLMGTALSWQESTRRLETESEKQFETVTQANTEAVKDRLHTYIDALHGFRGLFHSSNEVNEREYYDYFASLNLEQSYPGFNSIDYISTVPNANKTAFLASTQADNSLRPQGNPDFTITPPSDLPIHYVVTFVGVEGVTGGKGVDLASNPERLATLQAARNNGQPTASGSLSLLNPQGQEQTASRGFLVTIPVYGREVPATTAERQAANEGFVNAVFDYQKLFDHIFNSSTAPSEVMIQIYDDGGNIIYKRGAPINNARTATTSIEIARRTWTMNMQAPQLFGISQNKTRLPRLVAVLGLLLAIFLAVVFWMQNRSRQQAIDLASAMTEDIKTERNAAVATKNKDEAILLIPITPSSFLTRLPQQSAAFLPKRSSDSRTNAYCIFITSKTAARPMVLLPPL